MNLIELYQTLPFQCDKGWTHSYLYFYTFLFEFYRHQPITMCEFGVAGGLSHYMWDQFFTHPDTKIYGIDINLGQLGKDIKFSNRVKLIQSSIADIEKTELAQLKFDIALDDGPHDLPTHTQFFNFFQPRLKKNGLIIIEDVKDIQTMKLLLDLHEKNFYIDARNIHRWQITGPNPENAVYYDLVMCHFNADFPDYWKNYNHSRPEKINIEI